MGARASQGWELRLKRPDSLDRRRARIMHLDFYALVIYALRSYHAVDLDDLKLIATRPVAQDGVFVHGSGGFHGNVSADDLIAIIILGSDVGISREPLERLFPVPQTEPVYRELSTMKLSLTEGRSVGGGRRPRSLETLPSERVGEFYEEATRGRSASYHLQVKAALALLYHVLGSPNPFAGCRRQSSPPRKPSRATTPHPNWANCCANCARIKPATSITGRAPLFNLLSIP